MKLSLDSPVMEKAEGIADIIIAGFLWLIFSIPIITIGPASIALYYTVAKVCRRKRDTVWHAFLHAFKINLKQGIACTVIYLLYLGVIIFYFYITFENAERTPLACRKYPEFQTYFNHIWKELDIHV